MSGRRLTMARWAEALQTTPPRDGETVEVVGDEPLTHPELPDLLARLTEAGAEAQVHTDLPGLDDDLRVRPFAPFAVRFRVRVPTTDPTTFAALRGRDWEAFARGLDNLRAFAYATTVEVPVSEETVGELADTIAALAVERGHRTVHLVVPAEADRARWDRIGRALVALSSRALRPVPRITVAGMPLLALPLDALTDVDLRPLPGQADADATASLAERGPGDAHAVLVDRDALARRRVWLATPDRERPAYHGDPRDVLDDALSAVQVRDGHPVFLAIRRGSPERPALATTGPWAVHVHGRFDDPVLAARFATVTRQAHALARAEPPPGLTRMRALTHGVRRGLKPTHDAVAARFREEGD